MKEMAGNLVESGRLAVRAGDGLGMTQKDYRCAMRLPGFVELKQGLGATVW